MRQHSRLLDPRIDAARGDLADIRLAGVLFAPRYAAPYMRTAVRQADLLSAIGGTALSEVLIGERFEVLEYEQDHAWGIASVDGTVGYVAQDALGPFRRSTHVMSESSRTKTLPAGSRVDGARSSSRALGHPATDHVAVAEALIGTPWRQGGRSGAGVDAAGFIALALSLAGLDVPRFVDLQAADVGHAVATDDPVRRGDLLMFADHVAMAADGDHALHAAPSTGVIREPIADLIARGVFGPITLRKRLP